MSYGRFSSMPMHPPAFAAPEAPASAAATASTAQYAAPAGRNAAEPLERMPGGESTARNFELLVRRGRGDPVKRFVDYVASKTGHKASDLYKHDDVALWKFTARGGPETLGRDGTTEAEEAERRRRVMTDAAAAEALDRIPESMTRLNANVPFFASGPAPPPRGPATPGPRGLFPGRGGSPEPGSGGGGGEAAEVGAAEAARYMGNVRELAGQIATPPSSAAAVTSYDSNRQMQVHEPWAFLQAFGEERLVGHMEQAWSTYLESPSWELWRHPYVGRDMVLKDESAWKIWADLTALCMIDATFALPKAVFTQASDETRRANKGITLSRARARWLQFLRQTNQWE